MMMLNEEKNEQGTNFIMGEVTQETNGQSERDRSWYGNSAYATAYQEPQSTSIPADISKKKKKGHKMKSCVSFLAKAAVFGVIAGAAFTGITYAADVAGLTTKSTGIDAIDSPKIMATVTANNSTVTFSDVADIVEQAMPSVVSVVSRVSAEVNYGPFYMGTQEYDSSGSGIIVGQNDTELLIVTNNHVIDSAQTVTVTFSDGTPADQTDDVSVDAVIKGTSAENDLAVLAIPLDSIPEDVLSFIKVATLGNSDTLRVGEGTIAIGNALGYGQSVTSGLVSALNREVNVDNISYNAIQTSAAINKGNSGGALLNMKGEVIGINSAKYGESGVEGMGYAIPISDAMDVINDLMNRQTRTVVEESERGYLGIQAAINTDSSYASSYGIPIGVCVQYVEEGSAAEKAGIQKYDIITKFDGVSVSSMSELKDLIQRYKAGETVTVTIQYAQQRGHYEESEVTVTLGKRPVENPET